MASCDYATKTRAIFVLCQIPVALAIIIGLSFTVRRRRLWREKCDGRPGVLHPINLVNEFGRRWPFVACYIIITNDILGVYALSSALNEYSSWTITLIQLLAVIVVCLIYYPLFVCLSHNSNIASNVLGFFYVLAILIMMLWSMISCSSDILFGTNVGAFRVVFHLPTAIASCVLMATYGYDFKSNIYLLKGFTQTAAVMHRTDVIKHLDYVHDLLKKPPKPHQIPEIPSSIVGNILKLLNKAAEFFRYRKVSVFRFPLCLICTSTVCVLLIVLFMLAIQLLINIVFNILNTLSDQLKYQGQPIAYDEFLTTIKVVLSIANVLSGILQIALLWHMIVSYRRRILEHFHGRQTNNKLHANLLSSPDKILMKAMCYPGYQMMACLFGYMYMLCFVTVILLLFVYIVVRPLQHWQTNWILDIVIKLIPSAIISLCVVVIQWLLCKFLFTGRWTANRSSRVSRVPISMDVTDGDNDLILDLQNKRLFYILSYFMFVYNFIVGFFACLRRIAVSQYVNMVLTSRLDRVFFASELVALDPCHVAFMAMVALDLNLHNIHPVARVFVELLQNTPTAQAYIMAIEHNRSLRRQQNRGLPREGPDDISRHLIGSSVIRVPARVAAPDDGNSPGTAAAAAAAETNGCYSTSSPSLATSQVVDPRGGGETIDRAPMRMKKRRRLRRRWMKLLTLFNNPSLVEDHRKTLEVRIARKQQRDQLQQQITNRGRRDPIELLQLKNTDVITTVSSSVI